MTIKNLGHYEGEVEDISETSLKFKMLDQRHKELIILTRAKENHLKEVKEIDELISKLKDEIEPEVKSGLIDWAWTWIKKSGRVKWKEEFVKALGIKKAEEISQSYQTKEYPQIGIQFIDPIPESIVQIKDNPRKFPIIKTKLKQK